MSKILKIGHRGAKGYEAENTLSSFEKALELKVDGIELDVHLSSDGQLIVIHDETIDRTSNGKGLVNELTLKELKAFQINNSQEIPTLQEVFDLVNGNCFINIELKGNKTVKPVLDLIKQVISNQKWNYKQFLISSFNWKMLQEVRSLDSQIQIGVLTEDSLDDALAFAKKIKAYSIHPDYRLLSKENVVLMQQNGFQVFPWTVNKFEDLQKIKSYNVNGIISDFPDRI